MLSFDLVVLGEQYFIQNENFFYFLWGSQWEYYSRLESKICCVLILPYIFSAQKICDLIVKTFNQNWSRYKKQVTLEIYFYL